MHPAHGGGGIVDHPDQVHVVIALQLNLLAQLAQHPRPGGGGACYPTPPGFWGYSPSPQPPPPTPPPPPPSTRPVAPALPPPSLMCPPIPSDSLLCNRASLCFEDRFNTRWFSPWQIA